MPGYCQYSKVWSMPVRKLRVPRADSRPWQLTPYQLLPALSPCSSSSGSSLPKHHSPCGHSLHHPPTLIKCTFTVATALLSVMLSTGSLNSSYFTEPMRHKKACVSMPVYRYIHTDSFCLIFTIFIFLSYYTIIKLLLINFPQ